MPLSEIAAASASVVNAGSVLYSHAVVDEGKEAEIRKLSLGGACVLPQRRKPEDNYFVETPLMACIASSYKRSSKGDTQVVYARPSIGKTTAFQGFLHHWVRGRQIQALMISSNTTVSYLTHMATVLGIKEEKNVLALVVKAMRTVSPSNASVLILDELNACGPGDCNIDLINTLMRYVCSEEAGICVYVVTQNKVVADRLCKLNAWQKIGPLHGLTTPRRLDVLREISALPGDDEETPWSLESLEWNRWQLTLLLEARYPQETFEKDPLSEEESEGRSCISFVRDGMTPRAALLAADDFLEGEGLQAQGTMLA